jgi:hypothetical protein
MASFQHDNDSAKIPNTEALPQMASSFNSHNSAFKPKVNYDVSSFSPRDGRAFLGHSTTPRDLSHILDSSHRVDINYALQEANQKLKLELQECQHRLQNAEQRASHAESDLRANRALQASMSPNDMDLSVEVSQISKRLPSPGLDNLLRGNSSRRPASRNGSDESDVRCENLLLVIEDLRARLASNSQVFMKNSQSGAGDESDLWRFAAMREQLRWADNLALEQIKKKEAALASLRSVISSCQKSIRLTPRHLLPEHFNLDDTPGEISEDAQHWTQKLLHSYSVVISKALSLENRNLALEHRSEELQASLISHQIHQKSDLGAHSFRETLFEMLMPHDDNSLLPTKPAAFSKTLSQRETARNLSGEFLPYDPISPAGKNKQIVLILKRFIHKYEFMEDILQKLAKNMNDQVTLVDSILAEFQTLVKCDSSDPQFYSIQRSFQFIHQELVRLDECFHLISNQPSNHYVAAESM